MKIGVKHIVCAALALLPFGAGVQAQPYDRHSLEITWGPSIPSGSHFSDKTGLAALSLRWEYRIIPQLAVGASVDFDRHCESGMTEDFFNGDLVTGYTDRTLMQIPLLAHVRYYPIGGRSSVLQPYVGAGIGAQWVRFEITGEMINTSQADSWGLAVMPEIGTRVCPVREGRLWIDARIAFRSAGNHWNAARIDTLGCILPSIGVGVAF